MGKKKGFSNEDLLEFGRLFGLGFYRVTFNGAFVELDEKARKVFGIPPDETDLSKYSIKDFYVIPEEREARISNLVKENADPFCGTLSVIVNGKDKILFDICRYDESSKDKGHFFGFISEIENFTLLPEMFDTFPTGLYEVDDKDIIIRVNQKFLEIFKYCDKKYVLNRSIKDFYENEKDWEYFSREVNEKGSAIKILRFKDDSNKIIEVECFSQRTDKYKRGNWGMVTEKKKLEYQVNEAEERLGKTTADINKLIHTFLHPVTKFSGNASLLSQVSGLLKRTIMPEIPRKLNFRESGQRLLMEVIELKDSLPDDMSTLLNPTNSKGNDSSLVAALDLKNTLSKMINQLDYSLSNEKSLLLLDRAVQDTALMALDELDKADYLNRSALKILIKKEFIAFLQEILFIYLERSARILVGEAVLMKQEVEALRSYIGIKEERKYFFSKHHIGKILEANIALFKAVLSEEHIEVDYKSSGNLIAEISKNNIDRVICNLFHNVKKYSQRGTGRFVKIRAGEIQPSNMVEFSIESFGVPIKKEEIESKKIWEYGYRGELVYETDRDGTGVGLADVKKVIEAHGGEVILTSEPVSDDGTPPRYKVPYLTKVTVRLPRIARRSKGVKNVD